MVLIHFAGWCARMCWWLFFWPVGLILSVRRGSRKRHQEMIDAVKQQQAVPYTVVPQLPPVPPPPPGFAWKPPPPPPGFT